MKILSFDLETAELWPDDVPLDPQSGLGISCAATVVMNNDRVAPPRLWYGRDAYDDMPLREMYRDHALELAIYLQNMRINGYTIITWNGSFDFQVLGVEIGSMEWAALLAQQHVDLMFAFMSVKGFPISLKAAAEASGSKKGTEEIESGALAPQMWADGKHQQVLDYVAQDAVATLDVACHLMEARNLSWITKKGHRAMRPFCLPSFIADIKDMTIKQALQWDDPDTSWMDKPIDRHEVVRWISEALNAT